MRRQSTITRWKLNCSELREDSIGVALRNMTLFRMLRLYLGDVASLYEEPLDKNLPAPPAVSNLIFRVTTTATAASYISSISLTLTLRKNCNFYTEDEANLRGGPVSFLRERFLRLFPKRGSLG